MKIVNGWYVCRWCGADLAVPVGDQETMEILTEHDDKTFHLVIVNGEELHRCEVRRTSD